MLLSSRLGIDQYLSRVPISADANLCMQKTPRCFPLKKTIQLHVSTKFNGNILFSQNVIVQ